MARIVILNADDLGYDPAVSRGILQAMREGVVSSATLMSSSPHARDAARQATGLAIGLHVTLVRFPWLSRPRWSLDDAHVASLSPTDVEAEVAAQLLAATELLGRHPTHLDVHRHLHRHPGVLQGLVRVAVRHHLPVRSVDDAMRARIRAEGLLTNDALVGDTGDDAFWTPERFEAALATLPADGVVELMCHPGHRPSHLVSGYGPQREVELATFVDPSARAALERHGVALQSWAAVAR